MKARDGSCARGALLTASVLLLLSLHPWWGSFVSLPARAGEKDDTTPFVEKVGLSFGDDGETVVAVKGREIHARAKTAVNGSGVLEGAWEVAGPLTAGREREYRPLSIFLRLIDRREDPVQTILIESPRLPSAVEGSYSVRISFEGRPGGGISQEIKYFIGETPFAEQLGEASVIVPESLEAEGPSGGRKAGPDTVFSWPVVPGSAAYQVELYDRTGEEKGIPIGEFNTCLVRVSSIIGRPPMAGLMVPGYLTETRLSQLAGARLSIGKSYLWRVISLDGNGRSLCESPFKEFVYAPVR